MSIENVDTKRLSIGTVVYLFNRNFEHPDPRRFEHFVIVSLTPRLLLFPVKTQLASFVLESNELILNQMELRGDVLPGNWIDCTDVVSSFKLEEIVGLLRSRSNVVTGKLGSDEIQTLRETISNSETLEKILISELLSGF